MSKVMGKKMLSEKNVTNKNIPRSLYVLIKNVPNMFDRCCG